MLPEVWEVIEGTASYSAESFETEGFIHCSFIDQLKGVLERYYSAAEAVVILEIDPSKVLSEVRVEASTNDEMYPHIYGPINMDSVASVSVRNLGAVQDGDAGISN